MLAVVVRAGTQLCALELAHVVEVMRPLPVEPLPGVPDCVLGVALVRGAPVPVVALEALLGPTRSDAAPARFVSLRVGEQRAALAVGEVVGVVDLARDGLAGLAGLADEPIAEVGRLDARLLHVLAAARLVPAEAWRELEARRGAAP
jgi:purine-binding chemotaxis protein CheW